MIKKFKGYILAVVAICGLFSFTVISPSSTLFGKKFNSNNNFTCCKGTQLFLHHYYENYFAGFKTGEGYTIEPIGKPNTEGCNIQCKN